MNLLLKETIEITDIEFLIKIPTRTGKKRTRSTKI